MYQFSKFETLCSNHFHSSLSIGAHFITPAEHLLECLPDLTPHLHVYIPSLVIYSQRTRVAWWLLDKKVAFQNLHPLFSSVVE